MNKKKVRRKGEEAERLPIVECQIEMYVKSFLYSNGRGGGKVKVCVKFFPFSQYKLPVFPSLYLSVCILSFRPSSSRWYGDYAYLVSLIRLRRWPIRFFYCVFYCSFFIVLLQINDTRWKVFILMIMMIINKKPLDIHIYTCVRTHTHTYARTYICTYLDLYQVESEAVGFALVCINKLVDIILKHIVGILGQENLILPISSPSRMKKGII